jgi:hypothetical protein
LRPADEAAAAGCDGGGAAGAWAATRAAVGVMTGAISRANARADRKNGREEERACITGVSWEGLLSRIEWKPGLIITGLSDFRETSGTIGGQPGTIGSGELMRIMRLRAGMDVAKLEACPSCDSLLEPPRRSSARSRRPD